jgi:hypothetical protein
VFCKLAVANGVIPRRGWDWPKFLSTARGLLPYAFEKSDAEARWGPFGADGRSLRRTGCDAYGWSCFGGAGEVQSEMEVALWDQVQDRLDELLEPGAGAEAEALFAGVGGAAAWRELAEGMDIASARY